MDAVALSKEEQAYFETGGEALPSSVPDIPQTPAEPDVPALETNDNTVQEPARDEKGRFVPHQALHAEREEHKKTRAELQSIREKQAILEDRWNTLLKIQEKGQPEPEGPPNPDEDIIGALKWQQEQILRSQKEREEQSRQQQEQARQQEAEREITTYWQSSVQDYASREPDFQNAAQWLSEYRHKQLEALAPIDPRMSNPAARNAQIDAELKNIIAIARQNDQNPAELVHQLAKGWGYAGAQQQQTQEPKLPDNLATIEAAQKASRTLTASGGKSAAEPLSAQTILDMPNDVFAKWVEDPANERRFKQMMGGR